MRMLATINTDGIDEALSARLKEITAGVDNALKETATFVRDDAKATTMFIDKTGNLRRSIRMRKSKFVDGGYIVTASGRNRYGGGKGYHAHLIEFGHGIVTPGGRGTGRSTQPRPFLRTAAEKGGPFLVSKLKGIK